MSANSKDLNQTLHYAVSGLDLHCSPIYRRIWVKLSSTFLLVLKAGKLPNIDLNHCSESHYQ